MSDGTKEKIVGNLECSICLTTYKDPHMALPCSHNFCKVCIESCLQISKHCPRCRTAVSNVTKNFDMANIVELLSKHKK